MQRGKMVTISLDCPDVVEEEVEVEGGSLCGEVVRALTEAHQLPTEGKGAWLLEEEWHGCSEWNYSYLLAVYSNNY